MMSVPFVLYFYFLCVFAVSGSVWTGCSEFEAAVAFLDRGWVSEGILFLPNLSLFVCMVPCEVVFVE